MHETRLLVLCKLKFVFLGMTYLEYIRLAMVQEHCICEFSFVEVNSVYICILSIIICRNFNLAELSELSDWISVFERRVFFHLQFASHVVGVLYEIFFYIFILKRHMNITKLNKKIFIYLSII